jgi:mono/diheme cytochrome c family protein
VPNRFREFVAETLRASGVAILSAGIVAWSTASESAGQVKPPRQDYASGAYLFQTFCASCHGTGGKSDGPVSDLLRQRPPDLTTITARHGGEFPRAEMVAVVDGRRPVPGHGSTDMPIWGDVLKVTEGHDDAIIKKRLDALVRHIETLQQK